MELLSLNGEWTARQVDARLSVPAHVPGCIHTDLLAAGEIPDPFFRTQELETYWVGEADWEYTRTFSVSDELLAHERVMLICDGLDTLATMRINGKEIARTDNMFRRYEFDVKSVLKAGANTIHVRFASALNYTIRRERERHLPGWNNNEKLGYHGYVRKEQCNFGWDWGIRTVTCGIWRDISLCAFDVARITDVHVTQEHKSRNKVDVLVRATAERVRRTGTRFIVRVSRNGTVAAEKTMPLRSGVGSETLTIQNPELWWPNTMGEQPLYTVEVELRGEQDEVLDAWSRQIGLRTLTLDRHKDKWGESFQFVVNGVPFFAKGANWIPADAYNNRVTPERYRDLVKSAADANMNMLRVWGGGLYEEDVFYDLCDEYGICVWQDFMFACYAYPTYDESFMETVEQEAIDNVKRLRHHASLALWCGNNELEQGLVAPEWNDDSMSWEDYAKLFDTMLPAVVRAHDGQTAYWPGSPHSPCGDRADHRNPTCGDAHLWDVWHGLKPFEWYRTCEHRFNSEFGFQSFPEPRTTYGYTRPEDRNVTSYVMEHHQRSGVGNSIIMHYMLSWFRLPTGFDETIWTSQILQGMAMKYAVEHWRRSMPRGMGTIYWQLNDTWPVASWASIDYYHRWKALHFMAKKFFAPLVVSGLEDPNQGTVEIHVTNDEQRAREVSVVWTITDATGKELERGERTVKTARNGNRKVHTLRLKQLLQSETERNLIVWLEVFEGGTLVGDNLVTFARPKHLELSFEPGISTSVKAGPKGTFLVTLSAKTAALWAWISLEDGDFRADDNFVHLRPGRPVTITVTPAAEMKISQFRSRLTVRSLVDLSRE